MKLQETPFSSGFIQLVQFSSLQETIRKNWRLKLQGVVPKHAEKAYGGEGSGWSAELFLNLCTRRMSSLLYYSRHVTVIEILMGTKLE